MNPSELDPELARLERALRERRRPHASATLAPQIFAEIDRAARRERRTNFVAVAACVAAMFVLQAWLSSLDPARRSSRALSATRVERELDLGLSPVFHDVFAPSGARLARLAPVQSSRDGRELSRGL